MSSRSDHIEEEGTKLEAGAYPATPQTSAGSTSGSAIVMLIKKLMAEAIGTFFIIFAGCAAIVGDKMFSTVTFPGICITWGLIVMAMIYTVDHISGAHFNPAVTITFTIFRGFPIKEAPLYILSQLVGATLASGALYLLLNPKSDHFYGTVPVGSDIQSFVLEIIISFMLMFIISGATTDAKSIKDLGGLAVGSAILLLSLAAGKFSGASMNPARSIGPAVIMSNYRAIWAYIFGPIIGMIAGAFAYNLIRSADKPVQENTKDTTFLTV